MTQPHDPALRRAATNLPELSVTEITVRVRATVETAFGRVRVRGEIGSCTRHSSGHVYLTLKDAENCLEAVIWRSTAERLRTKPAQGLEVVCTGRLTTHGRKSSYQLIIDQLEPAGEGALLQMVARLKASLAAEGLFDAARKRPLPYLPEVIGLVTSAQGAVLRDILHRLGERFPRRVLLWPVAVQGETAEREVAAAVRGFNALPPGGPVPRPDLLIVARGGGSLEDLMPFNGEAVVRAVAASAIPVISAVGHETDTTLVDFAADLRAPTPTAAAEKAVPVRADLAALLANHAARAQRAASRGRREGRARLEALAARLGPPSRLLDGPTQTLDLITASLARAQGLALERRRARLASLAVRLRDPRRELAAQATTLAALGERLGRAGAGLTLRRAERLGAIAARLRPPPIAPLRALLERLAPRPANLLARRLATAATDLTGLGARLESVSYRAVLARGFALVRGPDAQPVTRAAGLRPGDALRLVFADGDARARVESDGAAPLAPPAASPSLARVSGPAPRRSRPRRDEGSDQGSLL